MSKLKGDSAHDHRTSKRCASLTITKIRKYPGLEDLSDEEAAQAVNAIEKLSNLLFYMLKNDEIIDDEGF